MAAAFSAGKELAILPASHQVYISIDMHEAKIANFHEQQKAIENFQELQQGEFSNANLQEFKTDAETAGFTAQETEALIAVARRIARENQATAQRAKRGHYAAGARTRRQIWEREREHLTSLYGGTFFYDTFEVRIEVFNRKGKGQLRVILRNKDGRAFYQFNSSESELEAGLLWNLRPGSIASPLDG